VLIALIVFVLRVEKPSLAKDEVLVPGALAQNEAG
jgi:DHA1 family tetracycline resistance protein-like MFS transporter